MDDIKPTGQLHIKFFEKGEFTHDLHVKNLVVDSGLGWIIGCMMGLGGESIAAMAIGTGTNPAAAADRGLQTENGRVSVQRGSTSSKSLYADATFAEGTGTGTITELALFLSAGTLLARTVIPGQVKGATTSMQIHWTITLTS